MSTKNSLHGKTSQARREQREANRANLPQWRAVESIYTKPYSEDCRQVVDGKPCAGKAKLIGAKLCKPCTEALSKHHTHRRTATATYYAGEK